MTSGETKGTIILSSVAEDVSGIHLRVQDENGAIQVVFVPKEAWGEIKPGKDPKRELEIVSELLNGYRRDHLDNLVAIENFVPRSVRIIIEK